MSCPRLSSLVRRPLAVLVAACLAAATTATAAAPLRYHVEPLATPAGVAVRSVRAVSINEHGAMAGWYLDAKYGNKHPMAWSAAGTPVSDPGFGEAVGVNDAGLVAFTLSGSGAMLSDGRTTTPLQRSNPVGLNAAGLVTGWYSLSTRDLIPYVEDASGPRDFQALGPSAYTVAINDLGHVVGNSSLPGHHHTNHAFLWRDGVAIDLGLGSAADVNVHDTVVLTRTHSGDQPVVDGLVWREGHPLRRIAPLGTLAITQPLALNDQGWIVGYASDWGGPASAFLHVAGTTCAIDALLDDASRADGWHVDQAFDLDEHGTIVAQAWRNGVAAGVKLVASGDQFGC